MQHEVSSGPYRSNEDQVCEGQGALPDAGAILDAACIRTDEFVTSKQGT